MQILNETPFEVMALPGYDKVGREAVTVIAKGTFSLADGEAPEPLGVGERLPIAMTDEYWGQPGISPVKYESELALFKPFADLVLLGHAHDPEGRPTKKARVEFRVGQWSNAASVSSSDAMDAIPLHYLERVGGGVKWLRAKRPKSGFGFYPKQCQPRVGFGGSYDEKWRKERAPFLPEDFDFRFFQVGFPGLVCDSYLFGGERVRLCGVAPGRPLDTVVPNVGVEVEVFLEHSEKRLLANLDTLVALPDERKLVLVWRSFVPIGGAVSSVRGFRIREAKRPAESKAG